MRGLNKNVNGDITFKGWYNFDQDEWILSFSQWISYECLQANIVNEAA